MDLDPDHIATLCGLFAGAGARLIDLTHPLALGMPVWPTHPRFCQEVVESYERGDVACNHALGMSEHTGTHFDAPLHFVPGAEGIDAFDPRRFFGRMARIDARDARPREAVGVERLQAFERAHGSLAAGDAVFLHFGWDAFWDDPAPHARFLSDWPGLSREAALYLLEREVRIVGSDCLSIDCFGSADFPAHNLLLRAGVLIGENLARLAETPPFAFLISFPLPIRGGSGSPMRAIAVAPASV
jgi:kynurenine formamidase